MELYDGQTSGFFEESEVLVVGLIVEEAGRLERGPLRDDGHEAEEGEAHVRVRRFG